MSAPPHEGAGERYDYLIVGAGFAGSVLAERLASQHGARVLLIDRRPHVGGNAYDEPNEAGILYHKYGPHIFHTNSDQVVDYLSQFTDWRPYEHRVRAFVRGKLVPIPINRTTLNALFDLDLKTDEDAANYLASRAEPVENITTSEDVVINAVGRELYELFFRGYTRKQWGLDPSELDKQVTARIPTRTNTDDRYFSDTLPGDAARRLHRDVREDARPSADRRAHRRRFREFKDDAHEIADHIIYTGPIDEYFDFRFGKLPYRSLRFDHQTLDQEQFQDRSRWSIIRREDVPFTRISEYKHLTGQTVAGDDGHLRISVGGGRSLLSDPAPGEPGAVQALRGAGGRHRRSHLRRTAGDLPLLQHGPDRRPGIGDVPAHGRRSRRKS